MRCNFVFKHNKKDARQYSRALQTRRWRRQTNQFRFGFKVATILVGQALVDALDGNLFAPIAAFVHDAVCDEKRRVQSEREKTLIQRRTAATAELAEQRNVAIGNDVVALKVGVRAAGRRAGRRRRRRRVKVAIALGDGRRQLSDAKINDAQQRNSKNKTATECCELPRPSAAVL